jgi:hypothetical protein
MSSVVDVFAAMAERLSESISCEAPAEDPADAIEAIEQQQIESFGFNLNGVPVNP